MHSFSSHGFQFNYNSDYSGDIRVTDDRGIEFIRTFTELSKVVNVGTTGASVPQVLAIREFLAMAVVNEAISRLENMETDEVLEIPWLRSILMKLTDK